MTIKITRKNYDNGQLMYEIPYHQNQKHGIEKWWHSNGELQSEHLYHKGQLHGIVKWWHRNGRLEHETTYYEGQHHGIAENWTKDGKLYYRHYHLYNNKVTEEEYRCHELIKKLSGL